MPISHPYRLLFSFLKNNLLWIDLSSLNSVERETFFTRCMAKCFICCPTTSLIEGWGGGYGLMRKCNEWMNEWNAVSFNPHRIILNFKNVKLRLRRLSHLAYISELLRDRDGFVVWLVCFISNTPLRRAYFFVAESFEWFQDSAEYLQSRTWVFNGGFREERVQIFSKNKLI